MIPKVQLIGAAHIGLEAKLVKSTCTILKVCFRQIIRVCEAGVSFRGNSLIIESSELLFNSSIVLDRLNK